MHASYFIRVRTNTMLHYSSRRSYFVQNAYFLLLYSRALSRCSYLLLYFDLIELALSSLTFSLNSTLNLNACLTSSNMAINLYITLSIT